MLDRGADIHASNDGALRFAAMNGHTETVKLLLDRGADIHAVNDLALRLAAENGHTETVKLLLDRGARIHACNDNALYLAVYNGHTETVKVLLAHGATITPEIRRMAEGKRKSRNYCIIEIKTEIYDLARSQIYLTNINMTYSDLLNANWSCVPGDIIDSIVPYLPARDVLKLCLYNDTFNRRICQNQDSIVWKLLYQRDISNNVPRNHIASRYLDIMDEILPLDPNQRLWLWCRTWL